MVDSFKLIRQSLNEHVFMKRFMICAHLCGVKKFWVGAWDFVNFFGLFCGNFRLSVQCVKTKLNSMRHGKVDNRKPVNSSL